MNQENRSDKSAPKDPFWSEFQDVCTMLEPLTDVPCTMVGGEGQIIFQTEKSFSEAVETTLTMHCYRQKKSLFRMTCEVDEKDPGKSLELMFALKKIGLFYHRSMKRRETFLEEITKNYHQLHFFYTLPRLLSQKLSRSQLCQTSLNRICKILNVERGSIFLYDTYARSFQLVAIRGKSLTKPVLAKMNTQILDWLETRNRPLLVEDVDRFPNFKGKGEYRTRSFLSSPIFSHPTLQTKRMAGVINLADPVGRSNLNSHDLKFAAAAAEYAVFMALTKPTRSDR